MKERVVRFITSQWAPTIVGLILALIVISLKTIVTVDSQEYMAAARAILQGNAYPRETLHTFFRPPVYPGFIAMIWRFFPDSLVAIKISQAVLFAFSCCLIYRLGWEVTRNPRVALCGAILYAVNPLALFQVPAIMTEVLHTFLFLASMLLITRLVTADRLRWPTGLVTGVILGLATLCRPTALPLGFALGVAILWVRRDSRPRTGLVACSAAVMIGMMLIILPWALANWRATGSPILTTDATGSVLWLGSHPAMIRFYEGEFHDRQEFEQYNTYLDDLPQSQARAWEAQDGYSKLSLPERERKWRRAAFENIRSQPGLTAKLWGYKALAFWKPWLTPGPYSRIQVLASGAWLLSIYALSLLGAWLLSGLENGRRFLTLLGVLFVSATFVHALTYSMIRYRLPYVDPYLSILAAVTIVAALDRLVVRFSKSPVGSSSRWVA